MGLKTACLDAVHKLSKNKQMDISKWMTRITSIDMWLCHTLAITINKGNNPIRRWFDASVLPTLTFMA